MKKVKVVSDTHFNHNKILTFRRDYSTLEDMNEAIIQKWNENIQPKDKVIHLGDFAFGTDYDQIENIIKRLHGNITLILGNHDTAKKVKDIYTKYFKCLGSFQFGKYYLTHEPVHLNSLKGRSQTLNIHGHLHNGEFCSPNHINCCFDVVGRDNMITMLNKD